MSSLNVQETARRATDKANDYLDFGFLRPDKKNVLMMLVLATCVGLTAMSGIALGIYVNKNMLESRYRAEITAKDNQIAQLEMKVEQLKRGPVVWGHQTNAEGLPQNQGGNHGQFSATTKQYR